MNNLQTFENKAFGKLTSLMIDGEPWFIGKEVAEKLGYSRPAEAIRKHVDAEDTSKQRTLTNGGQQDVLIINEAVCTVLFYRQSCLLLKLLNVG